MSKQNLLFYKAIRAMPDYLVDEKTDMATDMEQKVYIYHPDHHPMVYDDRTGKVEKLEFKPEPPKCTPSGMLLMSIPPQHRCEYCGQTWSAESERPYCKRPGGG